MFLSKDRFEVVRVDCGIASIPSFMIDIPSSSKSIQFSAKMTRAEPDDKVELKERYLDHCTYLQVNTLVV